MLNLFPIVTNLVADNLSECKAFYAEKLGLSVEDYKEDSYLLLSAGLDTKLFMYHKKASPTENTAASFFVTNLEELVTNLTEKGVKFEQYDIPNGPQTDATGISERHGEKAAWLKDPAGHIIGLYQKSVN